MCLQNVFTCDTVPGAIVSKILCAGLVIGSINKLVMLAWAMIYLQHKVLTHQLQSHWQCSGLLWYSSSTLLLSVLHTLLWIHLLHLLWKSLCCKLTLASRSFRRDLRANNFFAIPETTTCLVSYHYHATTCFHKAYYLALYWYWIIDDKTLDYKGCFKTHTMCEYKWQS